MTLYTYGGTLGDVLYDNVGGALAGRQITPYLPGTNTPVPVFEMDGVTPVLALYANDWSSPLPGGIRQVKLQDATEVEWSYIDPYTKAEVRAYAPARERPGDAAVDLSEDVAANTADISTLDGRVSDVEDDVETAQTTAANAATLASTADTKATTAQSTATAASTAASTADAKADAAQADATQALADVDAAIDAASAAQTTATSAGTAAATAQTTANSAASVAVAAQSTADEALTAANAPRPEQGSVKFTTDGVDESAVVAKGAGGQTAPVFKAVDNTEAFNMLAVYYDRTDFNVPINVPYFTVSQSFVIDGAGRRFYWPASDPGSVPDGSVWADGTNKVLKFRTGGAWVAYTPDLSTVTSLANAAQTAANTAQAKADDAYTQARSKVWDVLHHGAVGNGSTDDASAIAAVISAASAGDVILFRSGKTFLVNSTLTINKRLELTGTGKLKMTDTGETLLSVTAAGSGTVIEGLTLEGPTTNTGTECTAVKAYGDSTSMRVTDLVVRDTKIRSWRRGLDYRWVDRFRVRGCDMDTIYYAAIHLHSIKRGLIRDNAIDMTATTAAAPVYGITMSRYEVLTLAESPVSEDCIVDGNLIVGPAAWVGIDAHAGNRHTVTNNTVLGAKVGISIVSGPRDVALDYDAPVDITISGNTVDAYGSSNTRNGIQLVGDQQDATYYATGVIANNVIRGYGTEALTAGNLNTSTGVGGILLQATRGVAVSSNTIIDCVYAGINVNNHNKQFSLMGNSVIDVYSDNATTHQYAAHTIVRGSVVATGTVVGNTVVNTGTRTEAYVVTRGLTVGVTSGGTGTVVTIGQNNFREATTPVFDTSAFATTVTDLRSEQLGFYTTTPIDKPTVTGSRGGNAALTSLLTQLAALGLITNSTS